MLSHVERDYMQLKHIALIATTGLVFAGCSLLPGQAPDSGETMMEETHMDDTMVKDQEVMDGESMMEDEKMMGEEEAMMEDGKVVDLVADNFTFGVDEIRVKAGEKLTVSVMNTHGFHDFVIDELDVNSGMIPEGDTIEIEIPTDKPGTYEYYCSVGEHRKMGMKGMLIIE